MLDTRKSLTQRMRVPVPLLALLAGLVALFGFGINFGEEVVGRAAPELDAPGSYRAFAEFVPGTAATPVTLGVDLEAPGLVEDGPISKVSTQGDPRLDTVTAAVRSRIAVPEPH